MKYSLPYLPKLLANPVWYVVIVAALVALTGYLSFLWWLVGPIALVWGGWLIQQVWQADRHLASGPSPLETHQSQVQAYKVQIDRLLRATANEYNYQHRQTLLKEIDHWTAAIDDLLLHLTDLRRDPLLGQDLTLVPQAIVDLERRLAAESNAALALQLEYLLAIRRKQLALLNQLQDTLKHAEIQVERTVSLLGTIYSQLRLDQSTGGLADYSRLAADIDEEVRRLEDQLAALQEVKGAYRRKSVPIAVG